MFLVRLIRLLFWAVVLFTVVRTARRLFQTPRRAVSGPSPATPATPQQLHRDPVCGRFLPASISVTHRGEGEILHFCSEKCRQRHLAAS